MVCDKVTSFFVTRLVPIRMLNTPSASIIYSLFEYYIERGLIKVVVVDAHNNKWD